MEDTGARVLITPADGGEEARRAAPESTIQLTIETDEAGKVSLRELESGRSSRIRPKPDDVALVLHTSGTTSRPKRVPLSHRNLTVSVSNVAETYQLGAGDVSLCVMPLFHVHGLVASTLATLLTGGTIVIPPRFNALGFWKLVEDYGVTWYSAVPSMHQTLLNRAKSRSRSGDSGWRERPPVHPFLQLGPVPVNHAGDGGPFRDSRPRGLWDDRGRPSDGLQPRCLTKSAFLAL